MLSPTGSSLGPQIRTSGALVTVGQNGAWTPIAAEQVGERLSGRLEERRRR